MHSFYELSKVMEPGPFVMTTVDTIFIEDEFADYVRAFKAQLAAGFDGLMGVTDFIDDERPLYVDTDEVMNVTGFYDDNPGNRCRFISGGIYGLTSSAFDTLRNCMERGEDLRFADLVRWNGAKAVCGISSEVLSVTGENSRLTGSQRSWMWTMLPIFGKQKHLYNEDIGCKTRRKALAEFGRKGQNDFARER